MSTALHRISVITGILFLLSGAAAAASVTAGVGEAANHTVTVYNPLPEADTLTLKTSVTGSNPDTFTVTSPEHDMRQAVTLQVDSMSNVSIPVTVSAQYCTQQVCTAEAVFTAVSQRTDLSDTLTVSISTETGDAADGTRLGSPLVIAAAAALFLGVVAAVVVVRRVLLT